MCALAEQRTDPVVFGRASPARSGKQVDSHIPKIVESDRDQVDRQFESATTFPRQSP